MRILVVEDDQAIRIFLERALTQAGYVTDAAATAAEAESMASAGVYDACIIDLGLPDADGLVTFTICRVGPGVEFTVEDNGGGFPQEVTDNMFQRRAKGKQSTGHGLGLAFVDSVLRAHDGRVTAGRSSSGGAKLQFTLPAMAAAPAIADADRREVAHS
jgi:signal transduction histidine kinase